MGAFSFVKHTQSLVGGNPENPSTQFVAAFATAEVAKHPHECFLCSVLCIVVPHYNTSDMPINRLLVFREQQSESTFWIGTNNVYNMLVANRHAKTYVFFFPLN